MKPSPYQLRAYDQVKKWVNGEWEHNEVDDECTPDFGCCEAELKEGDKNKRLDYAQQWRKRNGITVPPLFS